jgi:protein-S-isoprenylcysteine O-methyltransferase Ste14
MNFRASSFAAGGGGSLSAAIVIILAWLLSLIGVTVPEDVKAAFAVLIGFGVTTIIAAMAPHTAPAGWTPPVQQPEEKETQRDAQAGRQDAKAVDSPLPAITGGVRG